MSNTHRLHFNMVCYNGLRSIKAVISILHYKLNREKFQNEQFGKEEEKNYLCLYTCRGNKREREKSAPKKVESH